MARDQLGDLAAFVAVADERSFTAAAARLGVSPSALSHALRGLEERLGTRLLTRTTRSVAVTEAGARLLETLRPALAGIEEGLARLRAGRDAPVGTVRVTAVPHAAATVLLPALPGFARAYPDVRVEVDADDALVDVVAAGYDAGIRLAGRIERDMVALRLGPDLASALVASPAYLAERPAPTHPRDVARHRCLVHRRPDRSGAYPWPFREGGRTLHVQPTPALTFSDSALMLEAAAAGLGLAYVIREAAAPRLADGSLVQVMAAWSPPLPGYALYYPSRRQNPPALAALVSHLRAATAAARR